jgi:hypothetical protein
MRTAHDEPVAQFGAILTLPRPTKFPAKATISWKACPPCVVELFTALLGDSLLLPMDGTGRGIAATLQGHSSQFSQE